MKPAERQLLDGYLDGDLGAEEIDRLADWLLQDRDHARSFVLETHVHGLLRGTLVAETARSDPFLREQPPSVHWVKDVPAARGGAEAAGILETALAAAADVRGEAVEARELAGWGDLSHFVNAGIPTVGIGAGAPGVAHSAAEHAVVDDLAATAATVVLLVSRLLSGTQRSGARKR